MAFRLWGRFRSLSLAQIWSFTCRILEIERLSTASNIRCDSNPDFLKWNNRINWILISSFFKTWNVMIFYVADDKWSRHDISFSSEVIVNGFIFVPIIVLNSLINLRWFWSNNKRNRCISCMVDFWEWIRNMIAHWEMWY